MPVSTGATEPRPPCLGEAADRCGSFVIVFLLPKRGVPVPFSPLLVHFQHLATHPPSPSFSLLSSPTVARVSNYLFFGPFTFSPHLFSCQFPPIFLFPPPSSQSEVRLALSPFRHLPPFVRGLSLLPHAPFATAARRARCLFGGLSLWFFFFFFLFVCFAC